MSNFPQLLKRSHFASFDSTISRVYTSTPHSSQRYGDWGLKYPVRRQKGPRYIQLSKFDVGHLLGSDWRSAETEARLMHSHGRGRTPWTTSRQDLALRSRMIFSLDAEFDQTPATNTAPEAEYMPNINAMTPGEFSRYLAKLKKYRGNFLKQKIGSLVPEVREKMVDPEERTFVNLAAKDILRSYDADEFQIRITERDLASSSRKVGGTIQSDPHMTYGLAYSKLPAIAPEYNPLLYYPGRALDAIVSSKIMPRGQSRAVQNRNEGTNKPWAVSIGGLAAESRDAGARASIGGQPTLITGTDFTRENPDIGTGTFKITKAIVRSPPRVVDRRRDKPMATFSFDIDVQPVSDEYVEATRQAGTRAFSAADKQEMLSLTELGGQRKAKGGSIMSQLRSKEMAQTAQAQGLERQQNNQAIRDILAKLVSRPPTFPGTKRK